jgi:hypothetical protein
MGAFSEYLDKQWGFNEISFERKNQLKRISELRNRDVIVYSGDSTKPGVPSLIEYNDVLAFSDQLSNLSGDKLDIILETPGGFAEVVEDLVRIIRSKYEDVAIIIPGMAKSAGTIFSMAANDILMCKSSSLGPIDAQIGMPNGKRFSADAFLCGLEKIKNEVEGKKLNPAYIPILQNISPGEIQHCENAQNFSKTLVSRWLKEYKFRDWRVHKSTNKVVTDEEKEARAEAIAEELGDHSRWLTHSRSINVDDLTDMGLKISNYEESPELFDAISRYYTLMRMSFDAGVYKIFETVNSQIYRLVPMQRPVSPVPPFVILGCECPACKNTAQIQLNFENVPIQKGMIEYPKNNMFKCPKCSNRFDILPLKAHAEAQFGRMVR